MAGLCERPGCSEPVAVAYRFDAAARSVTLTPFPEPDRQPSSGLCRRHADSMVVPIGWVLDDRREEVPRLFKVAPGPTQRRDRRRPNRGPVEAVETPELFDDPVAEEAPATVAEIAGPAAETSPDETVAIPWSPQFDTSDDLDGLLNADSPLLGRAFGNVRRRPRR